MASMDHFDSNKFYSTNTAIHFDERRLFMFRDADNVAHNLSVAVVCSIFHYQIQ